MEMEWKKPTKGFLNSFGLTHLTKKGLHCSSVVINRSRDFLNCDARVIIFLLLLSFPRLWMSSANRDWTNLFFAVGRRIWK